jgi:hypothetical protein
MDRTVRRMVEHLDRVDHPSPETCENLRFVSGSQEKHRTQETVEFRIKGQDENLLCVKEWIEQKGGGYKLQRTWYVKPKDEPTKERCKKKMATAKKANGKKSANGSKKVTARSIANEYSVASLVRWMALHGFTEDQTIAVCNDSLRLPLRSTRCTKIFAGAKAKGKKVAELTPAEGKILRGLKPRKNGNGNGATKKNGNGKAPAKKAATKKKAPVKKAKAIKPITKESQTGRKPKARKS